MAKVTLLAFTPEPEKTVAAAAKLCYSPASIDTVLEGLTEEKTASFVQMLAEIGHESPIEHASFTFGLEGDFVIIVGYDPYYLQVADPSTGTVSDWNYEYFTDAFQEEGNIFLSYY